MGKVKSGQVKLGQSSQDMKIKEGQVKSGQVKSRQIKLRQVLLGKMYGTPERTQNLSNPNFFGPKMFLDPKISSHSKCLCNPKYFGPEIFLDSRFYGPKILSVQKNFGLKIEQDLVFRVKLQLKLSLSY